MPDPLVVIDADVLGRNRTGDETYTENLLRALPPHADGLRLAAITRRPDLVPPGIEPVELRTGSQELRMALTVPRLLRRLRPALAHFQHAFPLRLRGPAVLTVHDLSFERDPSLMGRVDRLTFRTMVPRSVRRAARVLAVSERTRRDLRELYGTPDGKIVVTPNGVDPAFGPGEADGEPYLLFVGAIQERKDPLAAAEAAAAVGLPLVVVGPEKEPALARELERRGARLHGYVDQAAAGDALPRRGCARPPLALRGLRPAGAGGDGVRHARSWPRPSRRCRRSPATRRVYAERGELADAVRRALAERERLRAAGLERAKGFSWDETARRTADVYREVLGA